VLFVVLLCSLTTQFAGVGTTSWHSVLCEEKRRKRVDKTTLFLCVFFLRKRNLHKTNKELKRKKKRGGRGEEKRKGRKRQKKERKKERKKMKERKKERKNKREKN